MNYLQVGDNLPFDSIYDSLINRIPPPPNQATQPVRVCSVCRTHTCYLLYKYSYYVFMYCLLYHLFKRNSALSLADGISLLSQCAGDRLFLKLVKKSCNLRNINVNY